MIEIKTLKSYQEAGFKAVSLTRNQHPDVPPTAGHTQTHTHRHIQQKQTKRTMQQKNENLHNGIEI